MNPDITPVVQFDLPRTPPAAVWLLDDAAWLLRSWRPALHDAWGQQAYVLIEQLSVALADAEQETHHQRELLRTTLRLACELDKSLDDERARRS